MTARKIEVVIYARLAREVQDWIGEGSLKVHIAATFPLTQAAEAHRFIESRQAAGKVLLLPSLEKSDL